MRRVTSSWSVIEGVIKQNANSSFTALHSPATDQDLLQLQNHFKGPLPKDFLTSLKIHDGMRIECVFLNLMTLLPIAHIIKWSQVQREVQSLGEFPGDDTDSNSAVRREWRWRDNWVPVMADAGGNLLVMDLDPAKNGKRGQLFCWRNYDLHTEVVAGSFAIWLDTVAEELLRRRFAIDELGNVQLNHKLA